MLLGSEGSSGVITEAWVRVQPRPQLPASRGVSVSLVHRGGRGRAGAGAVRAVPEQLPADRRARGAVHRRGATRRCSCSASSRRTRSVDALMERGAGDLPRVRRRAARAVVAGSVGDWREAFIRMPYVRDMLRAARRAGRHVRDGDHVGALRRRSTSRVVGATRDGARRAVPRHLPLHARLPGRPGARTSPCSRRRGAATRRRSGGR